MDNNYALLLAKLYLICHDKDCMVSLPKDQQADVIEDFNSTSRYLDDMLNIDYV